MSASGRNVNTSTIQAKLSIKMATCSILSHFRFKLIITSFSCPFEIIFLHFQLHCFTFELHNNYPYMKFYIKINWIQNQPLWSKEWQENWNFPHFTDWMLFIPRIRTLRWGYRNISTTSTFWITAMICPPPLTNNHYASSIFEYCFLFKNMNYIHQFSKQSLKSGGLVELWLVSFSIYSKKKGEGGVKIPRRVKLVPFFRFQFYIH